MGRDLSNLEVVVLAVYCLGGDSSPQHTEDVAVEADLLAPGRFRWRKYPNFISDELVRVFLSDAKKKKNGALLAGDGSAGWRLTIAGARLAAQLRGATASSRPREGKEILRRRRLEKARLRDLPAWAKYVTGETATCREAEAVFRIGDYTRPGRRSEMVDRLQLLFAGDDEMSSFLAQMAETAQQRG